MKSSPATGAQVLYSTRVEKLLQDKDGRVIGVEATDDNGVKYTIKSKATLLTTGGFGNNKDMLVEPIKSTLYYGPVSSTGDGHRMAMELGAKTQLMQYGKRYPNGIEVAPARPSPPSTPTSAPSTKPAFSSTSTASAS